MTKQEVLKRISEIDKSLKETRGSKQHSSNTLERQGLYVILEYLELREAKQVVRKYNGRTK